MAVLEMATSPPAYDASNPSDTGVELFLPSGDQRPCYASVAFAVAAAARAAYMSGTEDRSQDVKGISEYDLHHCSAGGTPRPPPWLTEHQSSTAITVACITT
jgi:hypothetical protein